MVARSQICYLSSRRNLDAMPRCQPILQQPSQPLHTLLGEPKMLEKLSIRQIRVSHGHGDHLHLLSHRGGRHQHHQGRRDHPFYLKPCCFYKFNS